MGPRGQRGPPLGGSRHGGGRLAPAALWVSSHTLAALAVTGSHFRGGGSCRQGDVTRAGLRPGVTTARRGIQVLLTPKFRLFATYPQGRGDQVWCISRLLLCSNVLKPSIFKQQLCGSRPVGRPFAQTSVEWSCLSPRGLWLCTGSSPRSLGPQLAASGGNGGPGPGAVHPAAG